MLEEIYKEVRLLPVGYIVSPYKEPGQAPRQGVEQGAMGKVMVFPQYWDALDGIEPGMDVILIMWYHLAQRDLMRVHPRGDVSRPKRGVFSLRSPARPNPIALSTVKVVEVLGDHFSVVGIDAVDGTPVLDIKPHVKRLDCP